MTLCSFAKSWLKYYRDNAELKKQHPPEELGRDFQEGSGWKCLPGRGVMEGGGTINRRKIEWDLIFMPGH